MSELNQVVQAILRDLAQARSASDYYSAHLAEEYLQSKEIMRYFKVPNIELGEVNINLKFAVQGVTTDSNRSDISGARVTSLTEGAKQRIFTAVKNQVSNLAEQDSTYRPVKRNLSNPRWQAKVQTALDSLLPSSQSLLRPILEQEASQLMNNLSNALLETGQFPFSIGSVQFYQEQDQDDQSELRFRVLDEEGKIVLSSTKSYPDTDSVIEAANNALVLGQDPKHYEVKLVRESSVYYNLKDQSGNLIARRIENFPAQSLNQQSIGGVMGFFQKVGLKKASKEISDLDASQQIVAGPLTETMNALSGMAVDNNLPKTNPVLFQALQPLLLHEVLNLKEEVTGTEDSSDPQLQLILNAEQLKDLPEASVSNIEFSTQVRNYSWTQVNDSQDYTQYKLIED